MLILLCTGSRVWSAEPKSSMEFTVEVEDAFVPQVIVEGRTKLPPDTKLRISMIEHLTNDTRGWTETKVLPNGSFEGALQGPEEGLLPGKYRAEVEAQLVNGLTETVLEEVEAKEKQKTKARLEGPSRQRVPAKASNSFVIGGDDGIRAQLDRFKNELESMEAFQQVVALQYRQIIKAPTPATAVEVLPKLSELARQADALFMTAKLRFHAKDLVAMVESICISARIQRPDLVLTGQKSYAAAVSDWNSYRHALKEELSNESVSKPTPAELPD